MEFKKAMTMVGDAYERAFDNLLCHPNVYENKGMTRICENKIDACLALMQGVADLKKKLEEAEKKLAECEPKRGHWVETSFGEECSRCGYLPKFRKDDARLYCQSCGAIMDEAVE